MITTPESAAADIIKIMSGSLFIISLEAQIIRVNPAACDLLGYKENELVGQPVGMIFEEEEEEEEEQQQQQQQQLFKGTSLEKIIQEGAIKERDSIIRSKSGEKIPVAISGTVLKDKTGELRGLVCIAHDMRLYKKMYSELEVLNQTLEDKVRERTFVLSILSEISNALCYTLDYEQLMKLIINSIFKIVDYDICAGLLFEANTATIIIGPAYPESAVFVDTIKDKLVSSAAALTGENIRGKKLNTILLPLGWEARPREKNEDKELKSIFNVPLVVQGKVAGMLNISSCRERAFSEEKVELFYSISHQASIALERLRTVVAAEKSKMESMVENMSEGVIMLDERGEVVVVNPKAREWFGFAPAGVVETAALMQKLKEFGLDKVMEECKSKKSLVSNEITLSRRGKNTVLRCDTSEVKDHEGKIVGTDIILVDITAQKELDQMKTDFISTVSHELRTPLATIQGVVSNLLDGIVGDFSPQQREYLAMANEDALRLGRLIDNLLDLSRLDARKVELHRSQVDIIRTIKQCLHEMEPKAKEKKINLTGNFPEQLPLLPVDEDRIKEVLINLLSNAVKFTIEGGGVTVSAGNGGNKEVKIRVADTGIGIPKELLPRLFNKFYQIGRTAGPGAKGTGLGLAISKEIVELHGGKIWAESTEGKGSVFCFTLPIEMETSD